MKKTIALIVLAVLTTVAFTGCGGRFMKESELLDVKTNPTGQITIVYENKDGRELFKETFNFELYYKAAPITVTNFIKLVQDKFYDGMLFHAVEISDETDTPRNFVGGKYEKYKTNEYDERIDLTEKSIKYKIKGEFSDNGWKPNLTDAEAEAMSVKHGVGTMAMFREEGKNDSAASAFYISTGKMPKRDGKYAAFGKLTSNTSFLTGEMTNTVKSEQFTNEDGKVWYNVPEGLLYIQSITVDTKGVTFGEPIKM